MYDIIEGHRSDIWIQDDTPMNEYNKEPNGVNIKVNDVWNNAVYVDILV